jgi:hypothetical protein
MVDFIPKPGFQNDEREAYKKACPSPKPNAISVHCYGEVIYLQKKIIFFFFFYSIPLMLIILDLYIMYQKMVLIPTVVHLKRPGFHMSMQIECFCMNR